MNKQKFLKELEKRLAILNQEEKDDTINEYRDIIEEKVKHGKSEEEAVKEFGSIDELTKEILSAYKINPEYQTNKDNTKDKTKEFVETTETFIKKGAQKISEVASEVAESVTNSNTFTTENVIHIVFKIFFMLLGLAILRIPFSMISEIGESIFEIDFLPFYGLLQIVWKVLIEFIYIIACILIIITFVKRNFNQETMEEKEQKSIFKDSIAQGKRKQENQHRNRKESNTHSMDTILMTIIKICTCVFILFPICCVSFGLMIALAFVIYFICNGVSMIGVLLALLGILIIGFEFCHMIYNLLFMGKKYHFSSLIVGLIITLVGIVSTIDYFMGFTFYHTLPKDKFKTKTVTYEEQITVPTWISNNDLEVIIDSNLEDNQVKIDVTYYDENNASIYRQFYTMDSENYLYFSINHQSQSFNWNRDINDKLIEQLKSKEIYDYDLLDEVKVKVYVNETTKDLIQ